MSFILTDISQLFTLEGVQRKSGRRVTVEDLGCVQNASMVVSQKSTSKSAKVAWVGKKSDLPDTFKKLKKISAKGRLALPSFVDSHTHLVFAGDRSREFEMRLAGKTYQDIAKAGGGITATMGATRETSEKELLRMAVQRVQNFLKQGVTTIEIKTGYGLDFESEKKILKVIRSLKNKTDALIFATFLAAHAVPPEFRNRREEYVKALSYDWLPKLKKTCDFVDIFLDQGYFTQEDAEILFKEAGKHGKPLRVHADELELTGGAETAVKFQALSADHLLKITDREIRLLASSDVTATLLPTTAFFLDTPFAPARKLLDAGARVALASDFNPGTSPTQDISLVGLLAALQMKMRTEEIIAALTFNGAYALGIASKRGTLIPGYEADFILVEATSPAHFFYSFGQRNSDLRVFTNGKFL